MKTIVDNLAIEYADEGFGPIILMLHGWADTMHTFDAILSYITNYRVIRLDFPGFGGSERPQQVWGVEEYALFVKAFCKKLEFEPEGIIGHSFGGRIIIKGVGIGLFKPKKIVLIASAGVQKKRTLKNHIFRVVAKTGKAVTLVWPFSAWRHNIRKKLYHSIGSDYFASGSMRHIFLKVIREDLLPYAKNIHIPTLLIWGREDASTPLSDGEKIHEAIQESQLEIIDGASHFVHQEQPHKVAAAIQKFI